MVIGGESCLLEPSRLITREHAECAADLQSQGRYAAYHVENLVELISLRRLAPSSAHAETSRPLGLSPPGSRKNFRKTSELFAAQTRRVVSTLRTIGTILRTSPGLDRKQAAQLDFVGAMKPAMNQLRAKDQFRQGKAITVSDFLSRPVVAYSHSQQFHL